MHLASQIEDDLFSSSRGSAIESENLALIKILIDHGANPSIRDKDGKFPYELAKDECIKNYLESITDKDVKNSNERETIVQQNKLYEDFKAEAEIKKELEQKVEMERYKRLMQRQREEEERKRQNEESQK